MKNSLQATLEFDFRGERFTPSITVDLDSAIIRNGHLEKLYDMLATSIGLDSYRYEYDVMVMQEITFSEPTGLACEFICDGKFDFDGFALQWARQQIITAVQPIAEKHLNISDLAQHKDIQAALIECYQAGQKKRPK
ncbi:hypothetical protein F3F96_11995 [Mariprofundus sp. NF]|jgi:hypothetical protein|uniref:hypothetical protein n=1 Tax=Mariprofundus sp. NF TaxID=2608716 RepID=UPI0015A27005|nr:hypothetical protein [Mariprofundus sp. NF]NWF39857.1 hypothetical protein [Mariprofundus sp. NF]